MTDAVETTSRASSRLRLNKRMLTISATGIGAAGIACVVAGAIVFGDFGIATDFSERLAPPSWAHWFGTDQFGHDMFARTVHGLNVSLWVGLIAATLSAFIALGLSIFATTCGRWADRVVSFLVDATMGLPHLVLLILISFALGGGTHAVIVAVAVTHWPRLTRVLRADILQLRNADFIIVSRQLGKSWWYVGRHHFLPHLMPQMLVGLVLLFPHAILHEAGLTFIGFGLEPTKPAIGVLLADSMRYLTAGKWWLGLYPGVSLLVLVLCFDAIGNGLRLLLDPRQAQL
ncbi:ABC transporter permease [Roseibium sp. FZY0029]|uniref:ABC transporter permease n=1 Tax=Roseibium sp. FZY0029 TaxID=3116647 RepID=UPI002EBF2566|nr:ABC transporter permease [Roseibium sp. FZY0029]